MLVNLSLDRLRFGRVGGIPLLRFPQPILQFASVAPEFQELVERAVSFGEVVAPRAVLCHFACGGGAEESLLGGGDGGLVVVEVGAGEGQERVGGVLWRFGFLLLGHGSGPLRQVWLARDTVVSGAREVKSKRAAISYQPSAISREQDEAEPRRQCVPPRSKGPRGGGSVLLCLFVAGFLPLSLSASSRLYPIPFFFRVFRVLSWLMSFFICVHLRSSAVEHLAPHQTPTGA